MYSIEIEAACQLLDCYTADHPQRISKFLSSLPRLVDQELSYCDYEELSILNKQLKLICETSSSQSCFKM